MWLCPSLLGLSALQFEPIADMYMVTSLSVDCKTHCRNKYTRGGACPGWQVGSNLGQSLAVSVQCSPDLILYLLTLQEHKCITGPEVQDGLLSCS